ncbi:MAG: ABC transporter ATP-binding protein [Oscillospiraceae bacterium]|nr:ABC transporter ATP-binding protein [Oscillospiraceae bacterium]
MLNIFGFLKYYKKESILGPLFKLLEASFELMVPLIVARIIDVGIKNGDKPYIIKMCLLMLLFTFVGLCCSLTAQYFAAKAAVGFAKRVKHALFEHITSLSFSDTDELGTSTLITRMTSDVNQVQSGVNLTIRLLLRSPFVVGGAVFMAFTVDKTSALVFPAVLPLLSAVVFGIMYLSIPLYRNVQQKLDKVLLRTRENLTGVRVIRAFCREDSERTAFETENTALAGIQKYAGRISALMNPVTYLIINIAVIVLIYTGAHRTYDGYITQGAVVALYNYMSQILVELIKLANLIVTVTKAVACGKRINSVFAVGAREESTASEVPAPVGDNAVEFRHAGLTYKNAADEALTDISFAAKKGETIGIIGSTGSGKSTLVNMIPCFYPATAGSVLVNGVDVKEYPKDALRSRIGIVMQRARLFSGTIRENLLWGNENATDDEIMDAVRIAQAGDVVDGRKKGLDAEVEQDGRNFSGGQRQRLTIARALVRRPEILILDDSASALDFATDAALRKSLRELDYDPTVFIVSQRTSSVRSADRIIVLDDGKVAGTGTHSELLENCAIYREIYDSQFRKENA